MQTKSPNDQTQTCLLQFLAYGERKYTKRFKWYCYCLCRRDIKLNRKKVFRFQSVTISIDDDKINIHSENVIRKVKSTCCLPTLIKEEDLKVTQKRYLKKKIHAINQVLNCVVVFHILL